MAADLPVKAPVYKDPPPVLAWSWAGFYVGANIGYGWAANSTIGILPETSAAFNPFVIGAVPSFLGPPDPRGAVGGLEAGYNYQAAALVLGIESDLSFSGIRGTATASPPQRGPALPYSATGEIKLDWFGTLRGRLGFTPVDKSLVYVTGGLAYGSAVLSTSIGSVAFGGAPACADFCIGASNSKWLVGWALGGGWEYAFGGNWSAKLEYLYYRLGNISGSISGNNTLGFPIVYSLNSDVKGQIVRAGINYKFDWGPVVAKY
jgi:outer membrane immunogenic protein